MNRAGMLLFWYSMAILKYMGVRSMAETKAIIGTLKSLLRSKHTTYADIARGLKMSEANVKRMFATGRMTLERIESICQLIDIDLSDLFQLYHDARQKTVQLTQSQERQLVDDTQLLLVAVCVRNHHSFEDILEHYEISNTDLIHKLAQLDRLKIIDLLPNNKIKLRIAENFSWIPNGPIERFYEQAIQKEFLKGRFGGDNSPRLFLSGLLSESSQAVMAKRFQLISDEFTQLHRRDCELPMDKLHSVGILIAMRNWEFSVLKPYIKESNR